MKKVSVVIPTYQHAGFVCDAIDSVLSQTYQDYELIVVDDGSTDGTMEIVAKYGNQIAYLYQNNKGSAAARNTGIRAATGEYVAFLDADDVWMPNKLELEVAFLDTHPSVGMLYSNYGYFGDRLAPAGTGFDRWPPVSGHVLKEIFLSNPISSSAVLIRKSCFEKVGCFDESIFAEDTDMWLRLAARFEMDYLRTPLAKYRFHQENKHLLAGAILIGQVALRRKCLEANKTILNKTDLKVMRRRYGEMLIGLGYWYLSQGLRREARGAFWECVKLFPYHLITYITWLTASAPSSLISWIKMLRRKLGMKPITLKY